MRVAVIADFLERYNFNQRVLHGVAPYARMHGWELVQFQVREQAGLREAFAGADAILHGVHAYEHDPIFKKTRLPMAGWSASLPVAKWPRAVTDDVAVGRLVAEHLLARGFKHFAFYGDIGGQWVANRKEGFVARAGEAGHSVHLSVTEHPGLPAAQISDWLGALPTPLGLMTAHHPSCTAILTACRALGRGIPRDVAIVTVNNDDLFCEISDPPLSSISLQTDQIGYEAATSLSQLIEGKSDVPLIRLVPPGELVIRQSSDALAFSDPDVVSAMKFIQRQFSSGVATKQVVAQSGLSRGTLDAKFQSLLGRSIAAEIRRMGIEKAKQLLSTTELPMPAVAQHSGYSCARQFSESFRHYTGQTPTGYRRQFRVGATPRK